MRAERFAQCAGDEIDAAHDAMVFVRTATMLAHEADRVRIVNHHEGIVLFGEVADGGNISDIAIH